MNENPGTYYTENIDARYIDKLPGLGVVISWP